MSENAKGDEPDLADGDDEGGDDCWLCDCGNYIEDGLHCMSCGAEPPWGCPGECCQGGDGIDENDLNYEEDWE